MRLCTDIVPIGEAKANLSRLVRRTREEHAPIFITQNGRAAAVLISAEEWDLMNWQHDRLVREAVERAMEEDDAGEVVPAEAVRAWIASVGTDNELPPPHDS
jgi:prevent-host-death family protein